MMEAVVSEAVALEVLKELSRRRLLDFARWMMPGFDAAPFHRVYYAALDAFARGRVRRLIVSMPPQHGKSQGSTRFLPAYLAGIAPGTRVAVCSYSYALAGDFNRDVQLLIDSPAYRELFPGTRLSDGRDGARRNGDVLDIVGHDGSVRFVGRGGGLTGKTVDVAVLDDLYKDYAEANSPLVREAAWKWYLTVVRPRLHNESRELVVFTRWHEEDIIGRLVESEGVRRVDSLSDLDGGRGGWLLLNFPAIKEGGPTEIDPRDEGEALWPSRHSLERLLGQRELDPVQFRCLYQGDPAGAVGRLYGAFKEYTDASEYGRAVRRGCYVDVADGGGDWLVAVCYEVRDGGGSFWDEGARRYRPLLFALVTDVLMSAAGTEETAVTVPAMINRNNTERVWVESNNGGGQFAKALERKVRASVVPFTQRGNKESRILTAAGMVNSQIVMPAGWGSRFPVFRKHLEDFLRNFRGNAHDDPEDALTGVYEKELADCDSRPYRDGGGVRYFN